MKTRTIAAVLSLAVTSSIASAQDVTLNFDDLGTCGPGQLSSYGGWLTLASGVTCRTGNFYNILAPSSGANLLMSNGNMSWSFAGGPVNFNGLYASGYGSFFMELLNGGSTVSSQTFSAYGGASVPILINGGYAGPVDGVRISLLGGYSYLGVDDVSFSAYSAGGSGGPEVSPVDNLVNQPNATPEPGSMILLATGLAGVGSMIRRRRNKGENAQAGC